MNKAIMIKYNSAKRYATLLVFAILSISTTIQAQGLKISSAKSYLDEFNRDNDYSSLDKAKAAIDQAVADPKSGLKSEAWFNRGIVYITSYDKPKDGKKNPTELEVASESFQKAVDLDPKFSERPLCITYLKQVGFNYYNLAVDEFKGNNFIKAYENFVFTKKVMLFLEKNGDALSYTNKQNGQVSEISKKDLDRNTLVAAKKAGMTDKAIEMLQQEISANPSPELYSTLVSLYREKGENEKAKTTLEAGIKAFPTDVNLMLEDLNGYVKEGKSAEAIDKFKKAIELDPTNLTLHSILGTTYDKLGKIDEAKLCFEKALAIDPNDYNSNYNLGVNYNSRANEIIKRMNALGTSEADNKKYDALKVEQKRFYAAAKPYFEKCEQIKPGDEQVKKLIKSIEVSLATK